ncbi:hypothetical protein ACEQ8H_006002 [Pleosporales sp. CAS-2024a]
MATSPRCIGLIGLSARGSWAARSHLGYLQSTDLDKISALQNSSKASAEAAAKQFKLEDAAAYGDPEAIAKDPNVDIVAVSVNVPQHYKLVRPALEAGKDVFCEWPLARNLTEAEELVQLAKTKGVRTSVGLQGRQNPSILKAKEIVASGKLGRILGSTMSGNGSMFGPEFTEYFLYTLPIEAGANLVTIAFGHAVDALCYVLGEIRDISATLANVRPEHDLVDENGKLIRKVSKTAHDYVSFNGILANGGGVVSVTYAGGHSRTGREFYWEINGTEGSLILENPSKMGGHIQMFQPSLKLATNDKMEEVEVEKAADMSFNVGKAWDAWAGKGLDQGYTVTTWDDALLRHKMIDAIYKSGESGKRVNYV